MKQVELKTNAETPRRRGNAIRIIQSLGAFLGVSASRRSLIVCLVLVCAPALAVTTSHWSQNSAADFKSATLHGVVATNLSDVKLSRSVKTILEQDPKVSMVTALAQGADGVIYAGTSPQGVLLKIDGEKVSTAATIEGSVSITAIIVEPDGKLLLGASRAQGRVLEIASPGDKPKELLSPKDVQYIWRLTRADDGTIYAATGPNGQLFAIGADGKSEEIYKSDENNLTSLVSDGKNYLYVGTDPSGQVVRIDRKSKEAFVLYNADEGEITALAMDADGNLYAATGQSAAQTPAEGQSAEQPKETAGGRPQAPTNNPLPSPAPNPAKPPIPVPNPSQPPPIPQNPKVDWPRYRRSYVVPVLFADDEATPPGAPQPGIPGIPTQPGEGASPSGGEPKGTEPNAKSTQEAQQAKGNAIYKIDPDGFVTEVFREQTVIYSMIANKNVLLVGTGDGGEIYQVDPAAQETAVIAKTDAKEITSLLAAKDGQVYMGLSNTGGIAAMTDGYADSGTLISAVLDATQVSRFGVIQMHGSLPKGTTLTVATRAGNVKEADAQGWGQWSAEKDAAEFMHIESPAARFFQYRVTFKTTDKSQTPVINDVDVSYQMPHLAPVIKSIKVGSAPAPAGDSPTPAKAESAKAVGTGSQTITWESTDIDGDALSYSLYFQGAANGAWILLKDKLTDSTFSWDTRAVADGRYRVKVVASDAAANPPGDGKAGSRVSDAIVVDNTPPVIGDIKTAVTGHSVKIDLRVTDRTSTVTSMEYSVDSSETWQAVLPVDRIFDEPEETVSITIAALAAGDHQIALRAVDSHGNVGLQTVTLTVGEK